MINLNKGISTPIAITIIIALIFILIIHFLISIFSGAGPGRTYDARVMADMGAMRRVAEDYYIKTGGYTNLSCNINHEMQVLCDDIYKQEKTQLIIYADKWSYCAYVPLPDSPGEYYCINGNLDMMARPTVINPEEKGYCDGVTFKCPTK